MNIKNKILEKTIEKEINNFFNKQLIDEWENLTVIFTKREHNKNEMIKGSLSDGSNFYLTSEYTHKCNKNCFKLRVVSSSEKTAKKIYEKIKVFFGEELFQENKTKLDQEKQTFFYFWESKQQEIPLTSFEKKIENFDVKAKEIIKQYPIKLENLKSTMRMMEIINNLEKSSNPVKKPINLLLRISKAKKILKKIEKIVI